MRGRTKKQSKLPPLSFGPTMIMRFLCFLLNKSNCCGQDPGPGMDEETLPTTCKVDLVHAEHLRVEWGGGSEQSQLGWKQGNAGVQNGVATILGGKTTMGLHPLIRIIAHGPWAHMEHPLCCLACPVLTRLKRKQKEPTHVGHEL